MIDNTSFTSLLTETEYLLVVYLLPLNDYFHLISDLYPKTLTSENLLPTKTILTWMMDSVSKVSLNDITIQQQTWSLWLKTKNVNKMQTIVPFHLKTRNIQSYWCPKKKQLEPHIILNVFLFILINFEDCELLKSTVLSKWPIIVVGPTDINVRPSHVYAKKCILLIAFFF